MSKNTDNFAFKTRIYISKDQEKIFHNCCQARRKAYNWAVDHIVTNWKLYSKRYDVWKAYHDEWEENKKDTQEPKIFSTFYYADNAFKSIKKAEFPWIVQNIPYDVTEHAICGDLDVSLGRYYQSLIKIKNGEINPYKDKPRPKNKYDEYAFPKKKKYHECKSFYIRNKSLNPFVDPVSGKITHIIPNKKLGKTKDNVSKIKLSNPLVLKDGYKIMNYTFNKEGDKWYVSICISTPDKIQLPAAPKNNRIGIDVGVYKIAALSNETVYENERVYKKYGKKLAKEKRKLDKKRKYDKGSKTPPSNNWLKQKKIVDKLERKIANTRKTFLHRITKKISDSYDVIVLEDLNIKNMSKSAKGTAENPGKNVKQKSGLNRSILDSGWGIFKQQLQYKTRWKNGVVKFVDPAYTSKTCSKCGHVCNENRTSQEHFECQNCGFTHNADINAAKNIYKKFKKYGTVKNR